MSELVQTLIAKREQLDLEEIARCNTTVRELMEEYELDSLVTPISGDAIARL